MSLAKKCTTQCCTFYHERGHNRSKCPNKNKPCKSAQYCGEIARHADERDKLRELKAMCEKFLKEPEKETKEYEIRQGLTEKTMEDKIRDKLHLDAPKDILIIQIPAQVLTLTAQGVFCPHLEPRGGGGS